LAVNGVTLLPRRGDVDLAAAIDWAGRWSRSVVAASSRIDCKSESLIAARRGFARECRVMRAPYPAISWVAVIM
jgi:hypothetical protein